MILWVQLTKGIMLCENPFITKQRDSWISNLFLQNIKNMLQGWKSEFRIASVQHSMWNPLKNPDIYLGNMQYITLKFYHVQKDFITM